ncbi:MAG: N-acetylmuramoyl-L-alanine amidase [Xanthomonadales bacterium]|nr:N-acetylmuramoyl-L-alanine amidase [Xanthomonadales bacterium]
MIDLPIQDWPLPYEERLAERLPSAIDLVVIHCTELPDLATAREFGERIRYEDSQTGNSGHYYIDRDGRMLRFVGDLRVAHHTFKFNPRSIGIELVNTGRYPNWNDSRHQAMTEAYTAAQIDSLLGLLKQLRNTYPNLQWIAGHDALDQRKEPSSDNPDLLLPRRIDPGPMFPWSAVVAGSGLKRWPSTEGD